MTDGRRANLAPMHFDSKTKLILPHMPDIPGVRSGLAEVLNGEYRMDVLTFERLGRPPVVLDIGANIGAFTVWAEDEWPGCTVHAYEPHPKNAAMYRLNCPHIPLVEAAVVHQHDQPEITLYDGADGFGMASVICSGGQKVDTTFQVKAFQAADLPPCDFLKIDTEGSELPILAGYKHIDQVAAVALEWHDWQDQFHLGSYLAMQGFRCIEQRIREPLHEMGEIFWGHYGTLKFVRPAFMKECRACHLRPGVRRGWTRADGAYACRECMDVWGGTAAVAGRQKG